MRLHHVRRGAGEPLLLVHGIGDSHRLWSRVIGRLARAHEVYAVDMPGFGRSPVLPVEPTIEAQARAAAEFMRSQGHQRFHVAGNSMGGGIALELARTGAALSCTALSPTGFIAGWERLYARASLVITRRASELIAPHAAKLVRSPLMRRLLVAQMVYDGANVPPDDLAATFGDLAACPAFNDALMPVSGWNFPEGAALQCPTTIAWGSHDRLLLYRTQSKRARERLPHARHVTLERCGHLSTWDDAEATARVILETTGAAVRATRVAA